MTAAALPTHQEEVDDLRDRTTVRGLKVGVGGLAEAADDRGRQSDFLGDFAHGRLLGGLAGLQMPLWETRRLPSTIAIVLLSERDFGAGRLHADDHAPGTRFRRLR